MTRGALGALGVLLAMLATPLAAQTQLRNVNVGDATIRLESTGQGQAIVFIHGWAQDLGIWNDQVAAFSHAYRVVRYDVRGFGESGGFADASADPDDLRILLDSLGIRRAHIVGLSRGAGVALRFAVHFPERVDALVLYGAGPPQGFGPTPERARMVAVFGELARAHGLDSLGKVVLASPLAWMPPDRPELQEMLQAGWAQYKGRDLLDPRPPSGRVPPVRAEHLDGIRARTLVIHGDHDLELQQAFADTLIRRIPNAHKVVIKDGGHGAHFAQPAAFNTALMDFFAGRR